MGVITAKQWSFTCYKISVLRHGQKSKVHAKLHQRYTSPHFLPLSFSCFSTLSVGMGFFYSLITRNFVSNNHSILNVTWACHVAGASCPISHYSTLSTAMCHYFFCHTSSFILSFFFYFRGGGPILRLRTNIF